MLFVILPIIYGRDAYLKWIETASVAEILRINLKWMPTTSMLETLKYWHMCRANYIVHEKVLDLGIHLAHFGLVY